MLNAGKVSSQNPWQDVVFNINLFQSFRRICACVGRNKVLYFQHWGQKF